MGPDWGGVVAEGVMARDIRDERGDIGGRSSDEDREPAWEEAGAEARGDGAATSAGGGAVGCGKAKERADHASARAQRGVGGGESSGRGHEGQSGGGSGGRNAPDTERGEESLRRGAPDGDEGGGSRGEKRARKGGRGQCQHNRQRNLCKECGGSSICQHNRQRSRCKECGGGGICQHNRIRSRCKTCIADQDESMPLGLEEL